MRVATIRKHPIGKLLQQPSVPLEQREVGALARWWDGVASTPERGVALALLDRLHASGCWLACGCTGDNSNPPLLAVTRRTAGHGGGLSLRRLMDRAAHSSECRFTFGQREDASEVADPANSGGAGEALHPDFLFHVASGLQGAHMSEHSCRAPSDRDAANHPLARRMFWLLHEARVNRWPKPYASSYRSPLLKLAETVVLAQGLFLRDVLYCDPRAWSERWMESGFRRCLDHGLKPQVWWLAEIEHAS